jgi:hypothetical protein
MSGSDNFDPGVSQTRPEPEWDRFSQSEWDRFFNAGLGQGQALPDSNGDYDQEFNLQPVNTTTGGLNGVDAQFNFNITSDLPQSDMQQEQATAYDTGSPINFNMDSYPNLKFDDVAISVADDQARPAEPVASTIQQTPATHAGVNDHSVSPSYPPTQPSAFAIPGPHPTFPATIAAGQYPSLPGLQPDGVLGARNLDHLRQQQAFQLAGATANHPLGSAQPLPTGNGNLDPRLRGGASDVETIGDHTSLSGHVNASEEAGRVMPTGVMPTATPGALRLIAPKPQARSKVANAAAQSTNTGTAAATPPVLPVKNRVTKAKKEPEEGKNNATKTSTNKAKQEVVRTQIHTDTLLVPTLADAQRVTVKQTVLNIADDDHEEVAANYQTWITRITKPFDADFRAEPENVEKFTEEGKTRFTDWQKDHLNKVTVILAEHEAAPNDSAAQYAQGCAWILFQKILDAHTKGMMGHVPSTIVTGGDDKTMKCSTRIETAIQALEQYPIVRYDLLKRERLEAILASPLGFFRRKVENMFVNYKKKGDSGDVRVKKEDSNETPVASDKPTATKKRKASPLASSKTDEVSNAGDNSLSNDEVARPVKRTKAGSKRVDSINPLQ